MSDAHRPAWLWRRSGIGHESRAESLRVLWARWAKDPRRVEVAKRLRGVILSQTNKILAPTEFSAIQ